MPDDTDVTQYLEDVQFPIIQLNNNCPPNFRQRLIKPHDGVEKSMKVLEQIPTSLQEQVDGYVHSSEVRETKLVYGGVNKLGLKPPKETDYALEFLQFARYAIDAPKDDEGNILTHDADLSIANQLRQGGTDSSAGYVPTKRNGLINFSSKRHNLYAAAAVNEHDKRMTGALPAIPHQVFAKGEVIKKNKAVRTIQIQGQSNYLIDKLTSCPTNRLTTGIAIGIKTIQGGYLRLFLNLFFQFVLLGMGEWSEFTEWLKNCGAHESDKTSWESSTNEQDGMPYLLNEVMKLDKISYFDKKLYARCLADYANPLISFGKKGYFAKWRIASGTFRTSDGNSNRHRGNNLMVCDLISMRTRINCGCHYCSIADFTVSEDILKFKRLAFIMGDDYLSPSCGKDKEFDELMDRLCGTTTKTELKSFFDPSNSAEFLRRRFSLTPEGQIMTYRDAGRMLAKLTMGKARSNLDYFSQALLSARYEAGDNDYLQDLLEEASSELEHATRQGKGEKVLESYKSATPQVSDIPLHTTFQKNDVYNNESFFAGPYQKSMIDRQFYERCKTGYEWEISK